MCDAPTWLVVVCSEKRVMNGLAYFHNRPDHAFAEAFLITDLLKESDAGNENNLLGKDFYLENRTCSRMSIHRVDGRCI